MMKPIVRSLSTSCLMTFIGALGEISLVSNVLTCTLFEGLGSVEP